MSIRKLTWRERGAKGCGKCRWKGCGACFVVVLDTVETNGVHQQEMVAAAAAASSSAKKKMATAAKANKAAAKKKKKTTTIKVDQPKKFKLLTGELTVYPGGRAEFVRTK